jgi:serine/threonine-protein kinase
LAQLCYDKGLHGVATRLWSDALAADPRLADDRRAQHRYSGACAAALAGSGRGRDEPPDEAARAGFRRQALDWLRAELAAWSGVLEKGPAQARPDITRTLQHWKADGDLAGVRDPDAVARLPEPERRAWRALWADVDALLTRAASGAVRPTAPTAPEWPDDPFAMAPRRPAGIGEDRDHGWRGGHG